jgi:sodium pump decarboxylase gamma subunit
MVNNLLTVTLESAAKGYPRVVSVGEAALYALLGFMVVFAGILLLIFIVWAVGKLMEKLKGVSAVKKQTEKTIETAKLQTMPVPALEQSDEPDEETVAVIMAALMAYYQTNYPKCEFTVKRIKRF